jgi:flagellar motor protein MotB
MRKARYALGLALLAAASLYLLPALQAAENPVPDSPQVSNLLTQAKRHAAQLTQDADEMKTFAWQDMSTEIHAQKITTIKEHTNNLGKVLQQLDDRHQMASPWQQEAIERITPLAKELAANIEMTIQHINDNQNRLHTPEYKDYLSANYELSSGLSALIADLVSYGKNKANYEKLGSKLELAGH